MTQMPNDDLMQLHVDDDGVIVVSGDIDMATGPLLDAAIARTSGDGPIVLDLGGVGFIDSSGLRTLLVASRHAADRHSHVVLRRIGPEVARLLEITGTTAQFTIESPSSGASEA
jgi:anti-anti-sigma factor